MGQAKQRGSLEDRVTQAQNKQIEEMVKQRKEEQRKEELRSVATKELVNNKPNISTNGRLQGNFTRRQSLAIAALSAIGIATIRNDDE